MSIEYDEKGKYYTNVIHKEPVPAIIQTSTNLIRGLIHVRHDERLKDELENGDDFLAVTDVSIADAAGNITYTGPFLAVRKNQIVWIMPLNEDRKQEADQ